jgi:hypothetical protein
MREGAGEEVEAWTEAAGAEAAEAKEGEVV